MEIIHKYFPDLSEKQSEQFSNLEELYNYWNEKINLISRKDIPYLYERHILHSLGIAKFFSLNNSLKILDVGTGGGFPGIPLAILYPDSEFILVDSIAKKINAVNEIINESGLKNCIASHSRAEKMNISVDFIVSRAVTRFDKFVSLFKQKVNRGNKAGFPNGVIYLKGGDFSEEIKKWHKQTEVYSLSKVFEEEFFNTKKIIYLKV